MPIALFPRERSVWQLISALCTNQTRKVSDIFTTSSVIGVLHQPRYTPHGKVRFTHEILKKQSTKFENSPSKGGRGDAVAKGECSKVADGRSLHTPCSSFQGGNKAFGQLHRLLLRQVIFLSMILAVFGCRIETNSSDRIVEISSFFASLDSASTAYSKIEIKDVNSYSKNIFPVVVWSNEKNDVKKNIFLAQPMSAIFFGDRLYIADLKNNQIMIGDKKGNLTGTIGRKGQGPNEFISPNALASNKKYLFVNDPGNGKSVIFNESKEYVTTLPAYFDARSGGMAADDTKFFITNNANSGKNTVSIFDSSVPFEKLDDFLPKISNFIDGNNDSFDDVNIAMDYDGRIYISYIYLPRVLIYDRNLELIHSIEIEADEFDETVEKNYRNAFSNPTTVQTFGIINSISVDKRKNVFLGISHSRILKLEKQGPHYDFDNCFVLTSDGSPPYMSEEGNTNMISPDHIEIHGDTLIVTSPLHPWGLPSIYGFSLDSETAF